MTAIGQNSSDAPRGGVRSPRGSSLACRGWPQEAAFRMLQNNLDPEVAERPDELVVYGGTGRAARSWDAYHAMIRSLTTLDHDETMLVQSGKPVGILRTHEWAPRVLIANSNLVPDWGTWDEFRRLEHLGLTMYGQMTAGSWIYIGTQGILQGTYECFAAIARKRFGGSLAGTLTVTAGLGGMGGAQPLAITMNGGVALCIEVDPGRAARRVETRYLDVVAHDYDDALRRCREAVDGPEGPLGGTGGQRRRPVAPTPGRRGGGRHRHRPDLGPRSRSPTSPTISPWKDADETPGQRKPDQYIQRARHCNGHPRRGHGRVPRRRRRGLRLREQSPGRGGARRLRPRLRLPRIPARLHPPAVLRGQGALPMGGPLRRPGGHRSHRSGGARGVRGRRGPGPMDNPGERASRLPGSPRPDLLAGLRGAPPPGAEVQRDGQIG